MNVCFPARPPRMVEVLKMHDCIEAGGTITWKQSVESSLEARSLPLGYRDRGQLRTNIGHIRVKMSGADFPDKIEEHFPSENGHSPIVPIFISKRRKCLFNFHFIGLYFSFYCATSPGVPCE